MNRKINHQTDHVVMALVVIAGLGTAIGAATANVALLIVGVALGLGTSLGWWIAGLLYARRA